MKEKNETRDVAREITRSSYGVAKCGKWSLAGAAITSDAKGWRRMEKGERLRGAVHEEALAGGMRRREKEKKEKLRCDVFPLSRVSRWKWDAVGEVLGACERAAGGRCAPLKALRCSCG